MPNPVRERWTTINLETWKHEKHFIFETLRFWDCYATKYWLIHLLITPLFKMFTRFSMLKEPHRAAVVWPQAPSSSDYSFFSVPWTPHLPSYNLSSDFCCWVFAYLSYEPSFFFKFIFHFLVLSLIVSYSKTSWLNRNIKDILWSALMVAISPLL